MKSLSRSFTSTLLSIGLIALLVQGAFAHTYLSSLVVGGTALAEGDCVRPHPTAGYDDPITLVSSVNMTCGFLPESARPANRKCPLPAGASMGVQWHHNNDLSTDDIMDPSHKGPIMFYLAKSDTGAGNVWFKIWEDGYDSTTGLWATDRMLAAGGLSTFTIPADIVPGNYLLRAEVIALHNGYELDGAQPYVGCAELTISGSGTSNPSANGVAFPGAYSDTDPGILINIYTAFPLPYVIPGPAVYVAGGAAPSTPAPSQPTTKPSAPSTPAPSQPTTKPTSAPSQPSTSAPSAPSGGSIVVQMNGGSSTWWLGVVVSGGSQATAKVEIMDSGSVKSWTQLDLQSYAYVFSKSIQLTLPISVRLTSVSGAQVTLTNVFSSWTVTTPISTGKDYSSGSSAPATSAPATSKPAVTSAPSAPVTSKPGTSAPSAPSSPSAVSVTVYNSANVWWFALTVQGMSNVASVEMKDNGALTSYALMTHNDWGYSLSSPGQPFVAPLTVRITDATGHAVTTTVTNITPGSVYHAA